MWLEFLKLEKDPFATNPEPNLFFPSPAHKEASSSIFYGIESKNGFVCVTGKFGVGKTTVVGSYMEGADPDKIRILYIPNGALSFRALLKQICCEFGVEAADKSPAKLVDALLDHLLDECRKGRNVVLIIDEAQNMPVQTLDRLRVLSNLETAREKLIQIVLVGQPELEARLNLPELRQLDQRIAIRSRIEALSVDESLAYIHHRLARVSPSPDQVFTKKALKLIIRESKGIPRTINILCGKALFTAFANQRRAVDEKTAKEAIGDFRKGQSRFRLGWKTTGVAVVVGCLAAAVFVAPGLKSRCVAPPIGKRSSSAKHRHPLTAVEKAGKSEIVPSRASLSASKTRVEPKTTPAVGSSANVSTRAALAAPAGDGVESLVPKAPENLSAPGGSPAQSTASFALAAGREGKTPEQVVIKKGDCVSKILVGAYGRVDKEMLISFKKLNPQIEDIDRIAVGEKVFLPLFEP